jgi:hypothetical protein
MRIRSTMVVAACAVLVLTSCGSDVARPPASAAATTSAPVSTTTKAVEDTATVPTITTAVVNTAATATETAPPTTDAAATDPTSSRTALAELVRRACASSGGFTVSTQLYDVAQVLIEQGHPAYRIDGNALSRAVTLFFDRYATRDADPTRDLAYPQSDVCSQVDGIVATIADEPLTDPATDGTTDTTPAAASVFSLRSVDWGSHTFDEMPCPAGAPSSITLTAGQWISPDGVSGGGMTLTSVAYGDVTGDGGEAAVIALDCGSGGSTNTTVVAVVTVSAGQAQQIDTPVDVGQATSITVEAAGFSVDVATYQPTDPHCCPSLHERDHYALTSGAWMIVAREPLESASTAPPVGGCPEYGQTTQQGDGIPTPCERIAGLQRVLASLGYVVTPDGQYGPRTVAAVRAFQRDHGLPTTGTIDPQTYYAILPPN